MVLNDNTTGNLTGNDLTKNQTIEPVKSIKYMVTRKAKRSQRSSTKRMTLIKPDILNSDSRLGSDY